MKIQFSDLSLQHKEIEKEMKEAINSVIEKGDFILGEDVESFEKEFAKFCNTRYAVGVSSGTAALFLALKSLGIKEGDEVIVPAFTYIATALAVSYTGAKPVFVDIDERTYNIDVNKAEKAITKNTKAIIPVHLYGQPVDMPGILRIAKKHNLKIIEDTAQAHGASIKIDGVSHIAGGIGDIGCFSFYPSKNMGALGDGGMVVTNDESVYKELLMFRNYGRASKYEHVILGYNSRLDTLQAAVLRIKLKKIDAWNNLRIEAADYYNELFKKESINIVIPYTLDTVKHVYHVYAVRIKERSRVLEVLNKNGISAIVHYPLPLHLQPAYKDLGYKKGDFPIAERISDEILSLPMYPGIEKNQIEFIVKTLKGAI